MYRLFLSMLLLNVTMCWQNRECYNLCSCRADCDNTLVRRKSDTIGATAAGLFRWMWWSPWTVTAGSWNRQTQRGHYQETYRKDDCWEITSTNLRFSPVTSGELLRRISSQWVDKIFYETLHLRWKRTFWRLCLMWDESRMKGLSTAVDNLQNNLNRCLNTRL